MREALRRALWLIPTVVALSILAFWVAAGGKATPKAEEGIPILFNPSPHGIQSLAWNTAVAAAGEGTEREQARGLLLRLGGAALPQLLPRLDTLDPQKRRQVALALMPIAARMQLPDVNAVQDGEEAVSFWVQFWQDHFVDFKPTVTRRVVSRFGDRATPLRKRELLRLDTYALDELVSQMARTDDTTTVRRLAAAAAHIAEKPWTLKSDAGAEEVARVVESWQAWWARHRAKYVVPQGLERLAAPLVQTRYVLWLKEAARTRFGRLASGRPALSALLAGAPATLSLFLVGLLGGSATGVALGAWASTTRRNWVERANEPIAFAWAAVPLALLVGYAPSVSLAGRIVMGAVIIWALGSVTALVYMRASWQLLVDDEEVASQLEVARSGLARVWRIGRSSLRHTLRGMATQASALLGGVFLIEYGLELEGWGRQTILAVVDRELGWLMLVVMATAIVLGFVHVAVAIGQHVLDLFQERIEALNAEDGA